MDNGFATCSPAIVAAVRRSAELFSQLGHQVVELRPPGIDQAYELELALLGADGGKGIDAYLASEGSTRRHRLLEEGFLTRMRLFRAGTSDLAARWAEWDDYRASMAQFFREYDAVLCPVYTQPALKHRESVKPGNFEGFSYAMAWNLSGNPAATVCVDHLEGLPVNVQVATAKWRDMLALQMCQMLEIFGGYWPPPLATAYGRSAPVGAGPSPHMVQSPVNEDPQS